MNSGYYSFDSLERSLSSSGTWDAAKNTLVLAFAGIVETIKTHENSIKELELLISNKPSRHEVKAEISEKVSLNELNERINHSNSILQTKLIMLEDKLDLSEIEKILNDYLKISDAKKIIETKATTKELNSEVDAVYKQIDKVYQEICESLAKLPNLKDIDYFNNELKSKATLQNVEELIIKTIEPIQKSLKSKADKNELLKKADSQDLRSLVSVIDTKVSQDSIEKLQSRLEKLERNDNISKKKLEKQLKDSLDEQISSITELLETRIGKHSVEYSRHLSDLNRELKHLQDHPLSNSSELSHLKEKLNQNISYFDNEIQNIKETFQSLLVSCRNEISLEKANLRDIATEAISIHLKSLDQELRSLKSEQTAFAHSIIKLKENSDQISAHLQVKLKELHNNYHSNLADIKTLSAELNKKVDSFDIENTIYEKNRKIVASLVEIKEDLQTRLESITIETFKKTQDFVYKLIDEKSVDKNLAAKADKKDLEFILKEIKSIQTCLENAHKDFCIEQQDRLEAQKRDYVERFTSIIVDLREKTLTSDLIKLIDSKASVNDVNKILVELHSELDEKLNATEFKDYVNENNEVINTLWAEIYISKCE